ncbi:MAG TPA: LuxR C-terminal-related transcriptional regulator, partial [Telluria sp.]|nr:LuxR C-terminal-related transcriptional regulator [Telluria sp.]
IVGDQVGLPAELSAEYAAHYHLEDPGREQIDQVDLGTWYLDERDFGPQAISRSPFYQDFLKRYELDSTMASPILRAYDGLDCFLSLSAQPGRDLGKLEQQLARLMPHLQNAARLRTKLLSLAQQNVFQHALLDSLGAPLLVANASGAVVMANRLGERWLSSPGNPFSSNGPDADRVLAVIGRACNDDGPRQAGALRLRRSDGPACHLTVIPMPAQAGAWSVQASLTALVMVNDSGHETMVGDSMLRQLFGLTPAQLRLLRQLRMGATVQEASYALGIEADTGRKHLKEIFNKLGVRRQTELHRLLGRLDLLDTGEE